MYALLLELSEFLLFLKKAKIQEEPVYLSSPMSPLLSLSHHVCLFASSAFILCGLLLALFVIESSLSFSVFLL